MSTIPAQTVPLIGFAPDAAPTTPGALVSVSNMVPTAAGMATGPSPIRVSEVRGSSAFVIGIAVTKSDEEPARVWVVGRNSPDVRVTFARFGNKVLCAATAQLESGDAATGATLAAIADAPAAAVVVAAANFVLAFNCQHAAYGVPNYEGDRWWCCAINDPTSWAPSVTTQATTGRIVDGTGRINAAHRLGDSIVAFKERSAYVGQYVGAPVVWQWARVPGAAGCFGARAVCDIGGRLFFAGETGLYIFDGARAEPVGVGAVRDWFLRDIHPTLRWNVECSYDPVSQRVWVWYPSRAAEITVSLGPGDFQRTILDKALVYDLSTGKWGLSTGTPIDTTVQILAFDVSASSPSFDGVQPTFEQNGQAGDMQTGFAPGAPAVVTRDGWLCRLSGASPGGQFSTWDIGDDDRATQARSVRLRYRTIPPAGTVTGYTKAVSPNGEQRQSASGTLRDGKFDARQHGRWHHFEFTFTGQAEVSGLRVEMAKGGRR